MAKTVDGPEIGFILDVGSVVLERTGSMVTSKYIRGTDLVASTIGSTTSYCLYNGHWDVVQLMLRDFWQQRVQQREGPRPGDPSGHSIGLIHLSRCNNRAQLSIQ